MILSEEVKTTMFSTEGKEQILLTTAWKTSMLPVTHLKVGSL